MEIKFHRDVNHNYMMLLSEKTPDPDAYENRVILANRIRGLLPCRLMYLNGDTYYSFDITSMQSLEILRGRRILSGDGFSDFLYELIDVLRGMEEYLLNFDHIMLTPDKIYIDPSGGKIGLVYFPAYRKDMKESLRELVEYLLSGTDPDDRRTTLLGYRVYHALQREDLLLGELSGLLSGSGKETDLPGKQEKYRSSEPDEVRSGKRSAAGIGDEEDAGRVYAYEDPFMEKAGTAGKKASQIGTGSMPVRALIVFFSAGLLIAAITYAFLHLELGKVLGKHSDLLIKICGACAVLALFAAAFHFAGKRRKRRSGYAVMEDDGSSERGGKHFSGEDIYRDPDDLLRDREDQRRNRGDLYRDPPDLRRDRGDLYRDPPNLRRDRGNLYRDPPDLRRDRGDLYRDPPNLRRDRGNLYRDPPDLRRDRADLREIRAGLPAEGRGSVPEPDWEKYPLEAGEGDDTRLLCETRKEAEKSVRLVPDEHVEDGGETKEIALPEGTVIIGKSKELADRVISRATVSRVHARIRCLEGAYYLMDLNSRNGTFLNGELLPGGKEAELSDGDRISFADAGYRFKADGDKEDKGE